MAPDSLNQMVKPEVAAAMLSRYLEHVKVGALRVFVAKQQTWERRMKCLHDDFARFKRQQQEV